jgi:energy-coupling factor transporter ATP-binding protein EcfA2
MVENWCTQSFDDAFQPIQELEIQCARERDLVVAQESGDPQRVLDVLESEYRRRVAARFGSTELRGIQLNHRVILDLDQVYVPLHLDELRGTARSQEGPNFAPGLPRRTPVAEIVRANSRMLIVGSPGSGKSTLVAYLASRCAVGKHGLSWPDRALPFVITVREIKDAELSPEWLATQLEVALDVVRAALAQQRAVLLVDGLDEAPEELRKQLVASLVRFAGNHPDMPTIVTSRPAGSPGEVEARLPGYGSFRLADLTVEEVNEFIDKWCFAAERSARSDSTEAGKQASAAAKDLKSRIARSRPVQRIAVNPLLATILCVVHRFLGRTIPEHRVTLYEKCTDALLYEWDRAKFPENAAVGNLDADQKRALLSVVATSLQEEHEAEISEPDVVQHFAAVLPQMGRPQEDALRIVREIRDRSGILVECRPGVFAFSHLTFQEYLTALACAPRSGELLAHLGDPWWHEVIALACGVPGCDSGGIIRTLLQSQDREAVFLAAKCLDAAINVPLDMRTQVESALDHILPPTDIFDALKFSEIGLLVAPILARRLMTYKTGEKAQSLLFFHSFIYEPIIPILMQMVTDNSQDDSGITIAPDVGDSPKIRNPTVGELAITVLCQMAQTSESARRAFALALPRNLSKQFLDILRPWEILGDSFRSPRRGKRPSTPARSIA